MAVYFVGKIIVKLTCISNCEGPPTPSKNKTSLNLTHYSVNLEEEVDNLRVHTSQDAATIHELKTCLEQEREGKKATLIPTL